MRNLITTVGLVIGTAFALSTTAPASAAEDACTVMPQQIRAALAGADADKAATAQRRLKLGEQLCRENSRRAAAKEFRTALKLLGSDANAAGSLAAK